MPSLFSRLKHRKTPSSSSELNSPSSPTIVQSPTSPARTTAAAPPSQERLTSLSAPVLDRSDEDVVLIDKAPVPASSQPRTTDSRGGRTAPPLVKETASPATFQPRTDPTGHSQAFVDEFQQPDLPTTSSNANNPIPDDNANYVSNSLPKLLELPRDLSEPFTAFPLPPGAAPPSQSPTPIAHVTSANRTRITDAERERPKPMISGSQAIPEQEQGDVEGRFRHVQSIPGTHGGRKSEESGRRRNNDVKDIPARGVSLVANPQLASAGSTRPNTPPAAPTGPRESLRSVWGPDTDDSEHIERHIANLSLNQNSRVSYEPKSTAALEAQRDESVATIATAGPRNTLSERGKAVFRAAGLGDKLGKTDTVDVHTKWMEPVVQVSTLLSHPALKGMVAHVPIGNRETNRAYRYHPVHRSRDPQVPRLVRLSSPGLSNT